MSDICPQHDQKGTNSVRTERPASTLPANNHSEDKPTILFLPGLGSDYHLFDAQSARFPTSIVLDWLDIGTDETMDEYARRLADTLPNPHHNYIICGDSLGGMIAPRVAQYLNVQYCVLISSIDNPARLPRIDRFLCCLAVKSRMLFYLMAGVLKLLGKLLQPVVNLLLPWHDRAALDQFLAMRTTQFYGMLKLLDGAIQERTEASLYVSCPIICIHGNRDRVIPIRHVQPDYIFDGGHLIIMTHADDINDIIANIADGSSRQ